MEAFEVAPEVARFLAEFDRKCEVVHAQEVERKAQAKVVEARKQKVRQFFA